MEVANGDEHLKSFTRFGYLMGGFSFSVPYVIVLLILGSKEKKGGSFPALFILVGAMSVLMNLCSISMLLVIFRHSSAAPIARKTVIFLEYMRVVTLLLIFPVVVLGFILLFLF